MATEIKVPTLGESVTTATVARWIKQAGEKVAADEPLVELETDKVTVEVTAPAAGVLSAISVPEGAEVDVGAVLGMIDGAGAEVVPIPKPAASPQAGVNAPPRPLGPVARPATPPSDVIAAKAPVAPLPAAAKMMTEKSVAADAVGIGTGKDPCPGRQGAAHGRGGRGTGEDDPPAPHHRGTAEGGAEHRRHADHLQRGGHDGGDGDALAVP
jgi:2-oxoglutarate dehydrogenase E2 component (dihydrolipoamide succinyltransferase)